MARHPRTGRLHGFRQPRTVLLLVLLPVLLPGISGCTRLFYRTKADKEVTEVLLDKDKFPAWKVEQYHVYPDPRARFADPTCPDRPPMPPDDPAAWLLSPHSQLPGKAGIARVEGTGYLDLLAAWDAENRAEEAARKQQEKAEGTQPPSAGASPPAAPAPEKTDAAAAPAKADAATLPALPCVGNEGQQRPFRIKLEQAVELGLINSREFQDRREDLYLTALPVTAERFAFAAQFLAFGTAIRERLGREVPEAGGQARERWNMSGTTAMSKLFPTGALLLLGYANRTVVELTGQPRHTISEGTVNLDLVQPLLQGGGRAVTLEPLTQVERNLLYEIRDFARFRKEYFVNVVGGTGIGFTYNLPQFRARLPGTVIPRGLLVTPIVLPGEGGISPIASSAQVPPQITGYLPVLLQAALLQNDRENVESLQRFLRIFRAFEEGGDVSRVQVYQVEQQLLSGQNTVLTRERDLGDSQDRFKIQLGLPPNIQLELDDAPVRPITRQLDRYDEVIKQSDVVRDTAGALVDPSLIPTMRQRLRRLLLDSPLVRGTRFQEQLPVRWARWERLSPANEHRELQRTLGELRQERRLLRDKADDYMLKEQPLPEVDVRRLTQLDAEIALGEFELSLRLYESLATKPEAGPPQPMGDAEAQLRERARRESQRNMAFRTLINDFILVLNEPRDERIDEIRADWPELPPLRVEGVNLLEVDADTAYTVVAQQALINRWDLMNSRAQLVDVWRQIAVSANSLLGVFNVRYSLESTTPRGLAEPFNFAGSRTRHQLILDGELPLVRTLERNSYRAALIAYQRERRALMAVEDRVLYDVRSELRDLRTLAEQYRIQKRQTEISYVNVEQALESFLQPPQPSNQPPGSGQSGNAAALTTQLLNNQQRLNTAQNQLYQFWVGYYTTRLELFRDLELLPLDFRGVWTDDAATCDPGSAGANRSTDSAGQPRDQRYVPGGEDGRRPERLPQPKPLAPAPGAEASPRG